MSSGNSGTWAWKRYGSGWRGPKSAPEVRTEHNLSDIIDGCTIPEAFERIQALADALGEPRLSMEVTYGSGPYDRDRDYLALQGWRLATKQEIEDAEEKHAKAQVASKSYLDAVETQLRRERPELFKS